MTLQAGYAATSTEEYSITGTEPVTVTKTSGNPSITWNAAKKKLDIAAGLAAGIYTCVLTATNGITPDATLTFTLIVTPVTGIDELEYPNPLKAWVLDGLLHITGLTVGKLLSIYSASGALLYHKIATSDEVNINLSAQGVYIIRQNDNILKVSFEN